MPNDRPLPTSPDAVVVIPGIMGSRLREAQSGQLLWGLDLGWYVGSWMRNQPWQRLALDEAERSGTYGRIEPDGLLNVGGLAPVLGGFEPYGDLVRGLRPVLAGDAAMLAFAYDWRLPVTHNAKLLAESMIEHLSQWRATELAKIAEERAGRAAKLVVIAHSMGGLLYRAMVGSPSLCEATKDVRAILTLGSPFSGAAKAALTLSSGEGGPFPLPKRRLRKMARTLPGLYDLLPLYRSIEDGTTVRSLDVDDVVAIGGDRELASASLAEQGNLRSTSLSGNDVIHYSYIGGFQPTTSSLSLTSGQATGHDYTFRVDDTGEIKIDPASGTPEHIVRYGDGTVPLGSAQIQGGGGFTIIAQQHGSLAKVPEAVTQAKAIILGDTEALGTPLGDSEIGFDAPELVSVETNTWVPVVGADIGQVRCIVRSAESGTVPGYIESLTLRRRDDQLGIVLRLPSPGMFRLAMEAGGGGAVTQLVLALPDHETETAE